MKNVVFRLLCSIFLVSQILFAPIRTRRLEEKLYQTENRLPTTPSSTEKVLRFFSSRAERTAKKQRKEAYKIDFSAFLKIQLKDIDDMVEFWLGRLGEILDKTSLEADCGDELNRQTSVHTTKQLEEQIYTAQEHLLTAEQQIAVLKKELAHTETTLKTLIIHKTMLARITKCLPLEQTATSQPIGIIEAQLRHRNVIILLAREKKTQLLKKIALFKEDIDYFEAILLNGLSHFITLISNAASATYDKYAVSLFPTQRLHLHLACMGMNLTELALAYHKNMSDLTEREVLLQRFNALHLYVAREYQHAIQSTTL